MALMVEEKKLQEILRQVLEEFFDPDFGEELSTWAEKKLRQSLEEKEREELLSLDEVFS
ncbi:hypothetical protein [Thermosulfurimonas sp.]|uniref:hypothetical protein n=1 Tax=Thermosulfurimonas sp. TaxID=2080236 RepID=UPI0025DB1381|nr:hypothetical protein [Thermosulfurimonas sp.]